MLSIWDTQFVAKPNDSASVESVLKLLVCLIVFSLMLALFFLHIGAWMVLPFAGLELLLVVLAFVMVMRHRGDYEMITITENQVEIERCELGQLSKIQFQRYWVRVMLKGGEHGKTSLIIGSHNKEVEFGRETMDNAQRELLAKRLKQALLITK